jgi:3-hydroxyisobutyrate dehydrogenase-like beta-hydroxyacid dehydrogenase
MKTIAILAAGAMGSAVGRCLNEHGARVLTSLAGRGEVTAQRAAAAHMLVAEDAEIARADIILSIVPPGEAQSVAARLAAAIESSSNRPIVVDCNAINVDTVRKVEAILARSGARFIDAGILGLPPRPGDDATVIYASGQHANELTILNQLGLNVRVMDGPIGAASALKMSYAGIVKGLTGVGTAMVLAATRVGAAESLREELARSQPAILARLSTALPEMPPKAYRWVAEMREIAGFLGPDHPATLMYEGAARLFDHIAADAKSDGPDTARLVAFAKSGKGRE